MSKICVNLNCINRTPVYSEHNSWSQGGLVSTGFTVFLKTLFVLSSSAPVLPVLDFIPLRGNRLL
jgi:hypothetical protein